MCVNTHHLTALVTKSWTASGLKFIDFDWIQVGVWQTDCIYATPSESPLH